MNFEAGNESAKKFGVVWVLKKIDGLIKKSDFWFISLFSRKREIEARKLCESAKFVFTCF